MGTVGMGCTVTQETPEELKHQARLRGLARQLGGLGGLGGQGLVEEAQEVPSKEPKMSRSVAAGDGYPLVMTNIAIENGHL